MQRHDSHLLLLDPRPPLDHLLGRIHWWESRAIGTSSDFGGCGEKTWAPEAANYKIDLASPLSFSSDLVWEVHARGHICVSRVSLYGLRKKFREEVFVFKCS